jgi:hypothetical protein
MLGFRNSGHLRDSERDSAAVAAAPGPTTFVRVRGRRSPLELLAAAALLAAISAGALWWFYQKGYLLYFGDALAHLNISRRIIDSRTPGYDQIGTVWLPLPHVLMLPFVASDRLWHSGLAGAIPAAACFVAAGVFLFAAVRRAFSSTVVAFGALLLLALNPNMLYLQSIPMTEPVFFCALFALAWFTVAFVEDQKLRQVFGAGLAVLAATLVRYDGWFLIPFVTLFFLVRAKRRRFFVVLLFAAVAGAGPLYWLAHNWWYYGDALEFFRGPFSAKGIYQTALSRGMQPYPGDGEWLKAIQYFAAAARLCAGYPLVVLAALGVAALAWRRIFWLPLLFLLLPVFYVASMHSGGTPIFVPHLWPHSYYNTRYGLAALPFLVLAASALIAVVPSRVRLAALVVVPAVALSVWTLAPAPESWICWKESQVNSRQRRAWTREAADFIRSRYRGGGILTAFGDITGVFQQAGIPLRETLHSGNAPHWQASVSRPDLFFWEEWAVASSDNPPVLSAVQRARKSGVNYDCVRIIALRGAPVIEIYQRNR